MIIQGRVVDKETQIPIPFIAVKLDDLSTPQKENIRDYTEPDGTFYFNVIDGSYQLDIKSPVHYPYSEKIFSNRNFTINLIRSTF